MREHITWTTIAGVSRGTTVGGVKVAEITQPPPPDEFAGKWLLVSQLPSRIGVGCVTATEDEAKGHAERWLDEFVKQLGATWPS